MGLTVLFSLSTLNLLFYCVFLNWCPAFSCPPEYQAFLVWFFFFKNLFSFVHVMCLNLLFFLPEICHQFWRIDNFYKLCKCLSYYLIFFLLHGFYFSFWNMNLDCTLWCLSLLLTFTSLFFISMWVMFSAISSIY